MDANDQPEPTFNLGLFTLLAVGLMVLADLVLPWMDVWDDETLLIGLSFGQVGAAVMWIHASRQMTWQRLAVGYAIVGLMACHYLWIEDHMEEADEIAMIFTIWAIPPTTAIALLAVCRSLRLGGQSTGGQAPRFGMRHLMVATTLLAVASLIVKIAMPELADVFRAVVVVLIAETTLLYVVAALLAPLSLGLFWKLAALACMALLATFFSSGFTARDDFTRLNVVQVTILAIFLVALHLDRSMRLGLAAR